MGPVQSLNSGMPECPSIGRNIRESIFAPNAMRHSRSSRATPSPMGVEPVISRRDNAFGGLQGFYHVLSGLARIGRRWCIAAPWTNVYGTARTLLALGTLGTLVFSHSSSIFRPAVGVTRVPVCDGFAQGSLFCLYPSSSLEAARWTAILILAIVAIGWRPRITGIFHWWVSASLQSSAILTDGGDQITQVLTFLLLPLTVTDPRTWHWQAMPIPPASSDAVRLVAWSSALAIRVQMAGVYLHAAVGKVAVPEWRDGTAVYYWLTDPMFGVPHYLQPIVAPILASGVGVAALTWGTMALEFLLFAGLLADRTSRRPLLVAGFIFHGLIAVLQGLLSFTLAMWAGLLLYLRPLDEPFTRPRYFRPSVLAPLYA